MRRFEVAALLAVKIWEKVLDFEKSLGVKCNFPTVRRFRLGICLGTSNLKGRVRAMRFHVRPVRALSVLVLIAVVNVYVFANGAISSGDSARSKVLLGKLVTMSNRPIMVNGAEAMTGTIILSGAQLTTPAANLATVQLDKVGAVTIAPSSSVTLTFDSKNVAVRVLSGDASLTTADGVKGTVVGPGGEPRTAAPAPTDVETARNWGIAGVAVGGAALVWAIIAWNKAKNAQDDADAANAALASLRACLGRQTTSPISLCTSF